MQNQPSDDLEDLVPITSNSGQILILTGLLILCCSTIYYFILNQVVKISDNWDLYNKTESVTNVISALSIGVALLIALGMKTGSRKIWAIIFASIYTLINLYWLIDRLIPDEPDFKYLQF